MEDLDLNLLELVMKEMNERSGFIKRDVKRELKYELKADIDNLKAFLLSKIESLLQKSGEMATNNA